MRIIERRFDRGRDGRAHILAGEAALPFSGGMRADDRSDGGNRRLGSRASSQKPGASPIAAQKFSQKRCSSGAAATKRSSAVR